eukprot:g5818.t1
MVVESGSRTGVAATPYDSRQHEGSGEEIIEGAATQREPPTGIAVGAGNDRCRQELSPLSSPEGLGEWEASEQDKEWCRTGAKMKKIDAAAASSGGGDDASPPCPGAAPDTEHTDKATPVATAAVHHEGLKQSKGEVESKEGLPHDQTSVAAPKNQGGLSGCGVEATAASEQQTKARDQAKRLALEVARLRSSLRATTSELNTERSARVRIEDEWWKKMGDWEVERGVLVASKQEAERQSRSARQEVERVLAESKAREAKVASECVAREAAQHKAATLMNHVLSVQDRLVQALQAEVTMTNRAREAAQDDARETKKQLRLFVQDFLLWRDRAKRLEARQSDNEALPPPQHSEGDGTEPVTTGTGLAPQKGSAEDDAGLTQTGRNGEPAVESIPEKYARYFETETGGYPIATADTAVFGPQRAGEPKDGPGAMETDTVAAAAAWSTRLAMTGSSSAATRGHFQRSMKAQQAASARLEKDLVKARADLRSIYAGSRTADVGGGGKALNAGLRPGTDEERLGNALSEGEELDEVDGGGGAGSNGNQCSPESPTDEEERSGGVSTKEVPYESVPNSHAVEGSHLARVLAALLGGDPAGRGSDAPTLSLRLKDFPPELQSVFGGGPAAANASEFRATSSKGAHTRCGETGLSQPRQRYERESPMEVFESRLGRAGRAAASENGRVLAVSTGHAGTDGCGQRERQREEGQERCSFTGAFHGYKAKSSLLQRWLDEKGSLPVS